FNKKDGNLFMSVHYIDTSLNTLEGEYTGFQKNGKIENHGFYLHDQKNGLWQKWDTLGRQVDSTIYQDDKALQVTEFQYHKNGNLSYHSFKDSLADTFKSISYNDKNVVVSEVFFKGQMGISKTYDSGSIKLDSLYTREEKEASFPGGQSAWIKYLEKNLDPNIPVVRGAPVGIYQVFIKFRVAKDGTISDVAQETHFGYGMENEVIRIIKKGPKWEPAIQYGRNVNAYRRQPVTFLVELK
ncbi:MAG: hypothetical protein ABIS01_05570, partial [Ferruginibacter sp.]